MRGFRSYALSCWFVAWLAFTVTGTAFASGSHEQTSLREDAATCVEMAFSAIDEALSQNALWIPAKEAAENARVAFESGDYELAITHAHTAKKFAELGIRQLDYPPYRHF